MQYDEMREPLTAPFIARGKRGGKVGHAWKGEKYADEQQAWTIMRRQAERCRIAVSPEGGGGGSKAEGKQEAGAQPRPALSSPPPALYQYLLPLFHQVERSDPHHFDAGFTYSRPRSSVPRGFGKQCQNCLTLLTPLADVSTMDRE